MVISTITISKNEEYVTLAADITFRGKQTLKANFTVSKAYESFISLDATPFLAAFLLPCMKTQENIYIDGCVSAEFLQATKKIMSIAKKGNIGLSKIKIRSKKVAVDKGKSGSIGLFFMTDIDSFYAYLKQQKKKDKITHFILPHGFTIPLNDKEHFADVKKTIEKIAKHEALETISVETNIGVIIKQRIHWNFESNDALASIALFLRFGFKQIIIPGGNYQLDKLWSTETTIIHTGDDAVEPFEKITKYISKSPLALTHLHACTHNNTNNCSRCYHCLSTMIALFCADSLKKAKTFNKSLNLALIKKMHYDYKRNQNIQGELALTFLKRQHRDRALQTAIEYSLAKSKRLHVVKRLYHFVAHFSTLFQQQ